MMLYGISTPATHQDDVVHNYTDPAWLSLTNERKFVD